MELPMSFVVEAALCLTCPRATASSLKRPHRERRTSATRPRFFGGGNIFKLLRIFLKGFTLKWLLLLQLHMILNGRLLSCKWFCCCLIKAHWNVVLLFNDLENCLHETFATSLVFLRQLFWSWPKFHIYIFQIITTYLVPILKDKKSIKKTF
jgi:hypothetical protein